MNCTHGCCSVTQSCPNLCNLVDCSMPGFPVLHCLPQFAQTHVRWVSDAIQPYYPLLPPSPPVLNLSQPRVLYQCVSSLQHLAKVMELQLQHQSFQWIFRVDFLQDLLAIQGTLKDILQHQFQSINFWLSAFFMVQIWHPYIHNYQKIHSFH